MMVPKLGGVVNRPAIEPPEYWFALADAQWALDPDDESGKGDSLWRVGDAVRRMLSNDPPSPLELHEMSHPLTKAMMAGELSPDEYYERLRAGELD